jgi:hypothetical protein
MSASLAPTIEEKDLAPPAAARVIAAAMRRAGRTTATAEDAAAWTGLPLVDAGRGLMHLARACPARLEVTEAGALRFVFAGLPTTSPPRLARAWVRLRAAWTTHGVPLVELGTWLVASLVVVAMGSALMSAAADGPLRHGPFGDVVEVLGAIVLFGGLLLGAPVLLPAFVGAVFVQFAGDAAALARRAAVAGVVFVIFLRELAGLVGELLAGRWLGTQLRGFFLGEPRPTSGDALEEEDTLADERQLIALIRAKRGVVGLGDLAGAFGWDLDEVHREVPRIVVDYDGSVVLDDDLHLALRFERWTAGAAGAAAPGPARVSPPPRFFACTRWFAALGLSLVVLTTLGGLAGTDTALFPGPDENALAHIARRPTKLFLWIDDIANDGFGLWPLLCVAAPLALRFVVHRRRLRQRDRRARLLAVLDFALGSHRSPRPPAPRERRAPLDPTAAARLGVVVDEDGTWSFPMLDGSQRAAAALRARRRRGASSSRVVFTA